MAEDLPELPLSQAMSRETSSSYCSTSPDTDMLPSLASPLPSYDFGFDLESMGVLEAPSLANPTLPNLDEDLGLMLPTATEMDDLARLERELIEQLDQFNGPVAPLPDDFQHEGSDFDLERGDGIP